MSSPRIRLIDIARRLDLSVSAVSQALRGINRIPLKTRKKVEEMAREMGYSPDPALSALSAYRTSITKTAYCGNLAIISTYLKFENWIELEWAKELYKGIHETSQRLGYKLSIFTPTKEQARIANWLGFCKREEPRG